MRLKMAFKMPQEFPTATLDITEDFHFFYTVLTFSFVIPSSKQKHTTGSLTRTHTHTDMTSNNYKQKATGHVTSLANGLFTGSGAPFVCEIPIASSNIKKEEEIMALDRLWGRPQALLQRRNVSSVRVGLANGTKRTPSQNWGTYYQSCPTNSA